MWIGLVWLDWLCQSYTVTKITATTVHKSLLGLQSNNLSCHEVKSLWFKFYNNIFNAIISQFPANPANKTIVDNGMPCHTMLILHHLRNMKKILKKWPKCYQNNKYHIKQEVTFLHCIWNLKISRGEVFKYQVSRDMVLSG